MNKKLLCIIVLLSYCSLNAVFHTSAIYYDPKSYHTAILLGNKHLPNKLDVSQKYQLMQEIAQIPNAHIITEDMESKYSFESYAPRLTNSSLSYSYFWSKIITPNVTNVEFRPPFESDGSAALYATRILDGYNQIQQLNTYFKEHKSESIDSFVKNQLPILHKMLLHPGTIETFNLLQRSKQAAGRPHVTEYLESSNILLHGRAALVDIAILSEITKARTTDLLSVVLASSGNIFNIAMQLETTGYKKIYDKNNITKHFSQYSPAAWNEEHSDTPINVKGLFSTAYDDKRLAIKRVPISQAKHVALNLMREELGLGARRAYHSYTAPTYTAPTYTAPRRVFIMGVGFGALYSCYKVMEKFNFVAPK